MTPAAIRLLEAVFAFRQLHGVGPTGRDLAIMLGRSKTRVQQLRDQLREAGMLVREPGHGAGFVPTDAAREWLESGTVEIPVVVIRGTDPMAT